jgi:ABC-2 type transport system ATP-binding protein
MAAVIRTEKLTKSYGSHRGIVDVDLEVQQGEVFGFLGPNGAGKTTTIRVLLDLIRPTSGKAFVFEIESSADPAAIHRRIGYLPGEFTLYDRLTGGQTLEYFGNLRGGVDRAYQAQLIERFDLDPSRRFREYSKGNKQKVGLVAALQNKPELLLLDEPTSGLDPLVQQTFFEAAARASGGRRHGLPLEPHPERSRTELRPRGDHPRRPHRPVDRVDALRDLAHHQVELRFAGEPPVAEFEKLAGVSDVAVEDHLIRMRVLGPITPVVQAAARLGVTDFLSREPSLEETFLAQYGRESAEVKS